MPLRRRPNSSVSCAKPRSFDCFDGFSIAVRITALNWRNASAVTLSAASRDRQNAVGRRLRDTEYLASALMLDRFRAAQFDFMQRG